MSSEMSELVAISVRIPCRVRAVLLVRLGYQAAFAEHAENLRQFGHS